MCEGGNFWTCHVHPAFRDRRGSARKSKHHPFWLGRRRLHKVPSRKDVDFRKRSWRQGSWQRTADCTISPACEEVGARFFYWHLLAMIDVAINICIALQKMKSRAQRKVSGLWKRELCLTPSLCFTEISSVPIGQWLDSRLGCVSSITTTSALWSCLLEDTRCQVGSLWKYTLCVLFRYRELTVGFRFSSKKLCQLAEISFLPFLEQFEIFFKKEKSDIN